MNCNIKTKFVTRQSTVSKNNYKQYCNTYTYIIYFKYFICYQNTVSLGWNKSMYSDSFDLN